MKPQEITNTLITYIINKLKQSNTPAINIFMPVIQKLLTNNTAKVTEYLNLLTDQSGNINIKELIGEMYTSILNSPECALDVPVVGKVIIGAGTIKIDIPIFNKQLILTKQDLQELKDLFNY